MFSKIENGYVFIEEKPLMVHVHTLTMVAPNIIDYRWSAYDNYIKPEEIPSSQIPLIYLCHFEKHGVNTDQFPFVKRDFYYLTRSIRQDSDFDSLLPSIISALGILGHKTQDIKSALIQLSRWQPEIS